jgi:hypothetical protein
MPDTFDEVAGTIGRRLNLSPLQVQAVAQCLRDMSPDIDPQLRIRMIEQAIADPERFVGP